MTLVVRVEQHGGPEVLKPVETAIGAPAPEELRLRQTAIGLNFIDTYHRSGLYPLKLPAVPGSEAAGVVEAVGSAVRGFQPGDRVAYAGVPGAYAEARLLPAERAVKLPSRISEEAAAVLMLKGMTAYYLLHLTHPVKAGESLLVHAAAGGVGSLLVPWAKALGATVIGTAGGPEKCAQARGYGCDAVIDYRSEDFVAEVKQLTHGHGVDVVYDGVGNDTCLKSLDCLKRRGLLVSFGNASGKPPAIEPGLLAAKGSLYLTRPILGDYISTRGELEAAANGVFEAVEKGVLKPDVRQRYRLRDAAKAHLDLEARRTSGASVLTP